MRRAFLETLESLAEIDDRIVLLTGDLGFTVVERFAERFPRRFFNIGVAEQNMLGVATGLAEAGFIPFTYSIATFATLRPYEFIRNGPVLHRLPVRIVGVGGGFEYGPAGSTHHALEDLAVMRVLPGLTVLAPADYAQARSALLATWDLPGPVYFRLGKNETGTIPGLDGAFELGRIVRVLDGGDLAIIATGSIAHEAVSAAKDLKEMGVSCAVFIAATISPPPADDLAMMLEAFPVVATVEAHYRTGGLGSMVSELVAGRGIHTRVIRFGVSDPLAGVTGSEAFLNSIHGISAARIMAQLDSKTVRPA